MLRCSLPLQGAGNDSFQSRPRSQSGGLFIPTVVCVSVCSFQLVLSSSLESSLYVVVKIQKHKVNVQFPRKT